MLKLYIPKSLFSIALAIAAILLPTSAVFADDLPFSNNNPIVTFEHFPKERQLYPRSVATNDAVVTIIGYETAGGFSDAGLRVMRSGKVYGKYKKRLKYGTDGRAYFEFKITIKAELANYDFEVYCKKGRWRHAKTARKVVAGDVYLVQGQSNAYAAKYDGSASSEEHIFIRSYGTLSSDPTEVQANEQWEYAHADNARLAGGIGQWATRMARLLKDRAGVPIAIINGAEGGKAISHFQRNDRSPDDLETNYGRLRHRVQGAKSGSKVRGIIWYQGEADARHNQSTSYYKNQFTQLYNDWKSDYRKIEKVYIIQIRTGCFYIANPTAGLNIQEAQRQMAAENEDIEIMTAKGIPQHTDACHNSYDSYRRIGDRMADLLTRDFYNGTDDNVAAPNISSIELISDNVLKVRLQDNDDNISIEPGALGDFKIENADLTVVSAEVDANNDIILYLSGNYNGSGATGVSYYDHASYGHTTAYVKNGNGIGMVSFQDFPLTTCFGNLNCLSNFENTLADFDNDNISDYADLDDDNDNIPDAEELNCNQGYFTMAGVPTASTNSAPMVSPAHWNSRFTFDYRISAGTITDRRIEGEMVYLGYSVPDQYENATLEITLDNPMDWLYIQLCDLDQSIRESASIQFFHGDMAVAPISVSHGSKVESLGGQIFRSKSNANQNLSCAADNRVDFQFNMPIDRILIEASSQGGNGDLWLRIGSCLYDNEGNNIADYQEKPTVIRSRGNHTTTFSTLYPNPVQDWLSFEVTNQELQAITLVDALGKQVRLLVFNNGIQSTQLEVSNLQAGHYVLVATYMDGTKEVKRFVKQ